MGYLISAKAFRLGWSINWDDTWYILSSYYAEFVFLIRKTKEYIYMVLKKKNQFKDLIYSKVNLLKVNNYFIIKIDVYPLRFFQLKISLKETFNNFLLELDTVFHDQEKDEIKVKGINVTIFLLILGVFFSSNKKNYLNIFSGIEKKILENQFNFTNFFKNIFIIFEKEKNNDLIFSLLFLYKLLGLSKFSIKTNIWKIILFVNWEHFLKIQNQYLKIIKGFVEYFFIKSNTILKLNFLTMKTLNVNFVVKYFNLRLSQKFYIKNIVFPLLKTLYFSQIKSRSIRNCSTNLNDEIVYKKVFRDIFAQTKNFFNKNLKLWFDKEGLLFLGNNLILYVNFFKNLRQGFFSSFLNLMYRFLVFFSSKEILSGLISSKLNLVISKIFDIDYFYKEILLYFTSNYNFRRENLFFDFKVLSFTQEISTLTSKLLYAKWFLKIKKKEIKINKSLVGFKFQFLGRFSRKQRASSIGFFLGKLPLNTIKNNIDFYAEAVPIANSLVNTKGWFFYQ